MKIKLLTLVTLLLSISSSTFAHFGSKGPFGGVPNCAFAYDTTTFYFGTANGGVYESTTTGVTAWRPRPVGLKSGKITAITHSGSYLFVGTADSGMYVFNGYVGTDRYFRKINNGLTDLQITSLVAVDSITILAGTKTAGVFKTTDKGATWQPVNNGVHHYYIKGFAKAGNRLFHISDGGVWVSDDAGNNWTEFADVNTDHINATQVSYNNLTKELMVYNDSGLYVTANADTATLPVFTSAENGFTGHVHIHGISNNGTTWILASHSGVFTSSSSAINWTLYTTGLPSTNIVFALPFRDQIIAGTKTTGIYKTAQSNISFTQVLTGFNNLKTYSLTTAGTDIVVAATEKGVFTSLNQAALYTAANNGLTDSLNVNDITFADFCMLAATKNQGVFFTADTGKTWSPANLGMLDTNVIKIAYNNMKKYAIGASGTVYASDLHSYTWSPIQSGLPSGIHPTSLAFLGNHLVLSSSDFGVFVKYDTAASWMQANNGLSNLTVTSVTSNGTKLFAGTDGNGVWVSDINPINWTATSPTTISHTSLLGLDGNKIQAMSYFNGYVFASYKGGLLASSDNGTTWIAGGNQFNLPSYTDVNKISFIATRVFVSTQYNGLYSNALSELPAITGINGKDAATAGITVYPNPSKGVFNIQFKGNEILQSLTAFDVLGKEVKVENNNNYFALPSQPGIYFVEVTTNLQQYITKLIVE